MAAPVVAPAGPLSRDGKSTTVFTANMAANWTTTGGTFTGAVLGVAAATWKAPNISGTYLVRATNPGTGEITTVTVTVLSILPNYWEWKAPVDVKKKTLLFEPDDGPDQTRSLSKEREFWALGAEDASPEEEEEMRAFQKAHHPGKRFIFNDPDSGTRILYQTDSDYSYQKNSAQSRSFRMRIKEAHPYGTSA